MKTSTQDWINFAKADLLNCELIINEPFLTNIIAFHSQQAVEKSFKALIEEKNITIPKVHSLQRLYGIIEQFIDKEIDTSVLALLDSVYTTSRYPGELGMIDTGMPIQSEALQMYENAKQIFEIILQVIEK